MSATMTAELICQQFNGDGRCVNPEVVTVPGLEALALRLEVRLGLAEDGKWRAGFIALYENGKGKRCGEKVSQCELAGVGYADRRTALLAAVKEAVVLFTKKKAVDAIDAFYFSARDGAEISQDVTPAAVAPVVVPAARVAYRTEFASVPIGKIQRNPTNHRKHFDAAGLHELADSLRTEGLHQPIGLRRLLESETPEGELAVGDPGAVEYELIYGERRWRAAQIAGLAGLEAKIYNGMKREQTHAIALIENLQRAGINAMEEADGYAELMAAEGLTQEGCAERVGRERSTVANSLRLRGLPEVARELIREGKLTKAHGVALARFVPDEKGAADFPKWEQVVKIMAEEAVESRTPAGGMEKGVPSVYRLTQAGLAVRISRWGVGPKMPEKFKRHAAYFAEGDGDWVSLHPEHWRAYEAELAKAAKVKAEADRERLRKETEAAAKKGKQVVDLNGLDREAYKVVDDERDEAQRAALSLVPDSARATARDGDRKVTVVTDVQLAERISGAMVRAIKKDRRAKVEELRGKVEAKVAKIKKVGPRELAWLVFLVVDMHGRSVALHLERDAAKTAGVKLVRGATQSWGTGDEEWDEDNFRADGSRRMNALAKCEGPDLVKALITERLDKALEEIVEGGATSTGAGMVRWWLDSDTLWLLEETDEGRAELVEQVKAAPWFSKAVAGEGSAEDEEGGEPEAEVAAPAEPAVKGKRARIADEVKQQVKLLVEAGRTAQEICKELGISAPSVQNIKKELGLVKTKGGAK